MYFYDVAVLGANLKPLTYSSNFKISPFCVVKIPLKNSQKLAVVLKEREEPNFKTKEILSFDGENFTTFQIELANFISYYYVCQKGVSFGIFETFKDSGKSKINFSYDKTPNLSNEQKKAYEFADNNDTSLIFGDTGSGKSEIYISLITQMLKKGKQALFLMPEISLTPQITKRLKVYFGDTLGVWHSKISPKKKLETLEKFRRGEIKIIAGARSALFLPFRDLGIIIVDEEHDDSYKSSSSPRINARDLAIFIGKKMGIKVVLGSATPSLTTLKKQPFYRLKGTYFETSKNFIYDENQTELTPKIKNEIKKSLDANHQIVVFLPTRANYKYMICQNCSEIVKCPFCSVGMSYHAKENALKCHYCGYSAFYKISCQKCGSSTFQAQKMGTSELVLKLNEIFPSAKIAKFDRDEITTQRKLENLLKDFNAHKIDILVGTQMLSKGHDYHGVDLAVIMGIDEHLSYPDFRAREKTLSLAMQVAGRAGRNGDGRVVLQTMQRDFFESFIGDYDGFVSDENEFRDGLYPPFTRLLRILIANKDEKNAINTTKNALSKLQTVQDIEIIGYGKAGIEYVASKFRYEILLRSTSHKALIKAANSICDLDVEIDMDPVNFS